MNNFGVGYAEDLKNGCNSHGEAIILNPSRRDHNYSLFNIHYSFKFQIAQQSDKQEFDAKGPGESFSRPGLVGLFCEEGLGGVGVCHEGSAQGV